MPEDLTPRVEALEKALEDQKALNAALVDHLEKLHGIKLPEPA